MMKPGPTLLTALGLKDTDARPTKSSIREAHAAKTTALREKAFAELKQQNDPRAFCQGDVFDNCNSPKANAANHKEAK